MTALRVLLLLLLVSRPATAGMKSLLVSLDVPDGRVPDWLCVVTDEACSPRERCESRDLSEIDGSLVRVEGTANRYRFQETKSAANLPKALADALVALDRPVTQLCSEGHAACAPEIDLEKFSGGTITCAGQPGITTQAHTATKQRVAFLGIITDPTKKRSGIQQVDLTGSTATITFATTLQSNNTAFVNVVGGDYAESLGSTYSRNQRALVRLSSRCSHFVVEVPGHTSPITRVSIREEFQRAGHRTKFQGAVSVQGALAAAHRGTVAESAADTSDSSSCSRDMSTGTCFTCETDAQVGSHVLDLEVPFSSTNNRKKLTVTFGTQPQTQAEATWTTALPPVGLRADIRSIRFSWKRPASCFAERWDDIPPHLGPDWTPSCPRAKLADFTVCDVVSKEPGPDESLDACEYSCTVKNDLEPLRLPIAVEFERVRAHPSFSVATVGTKPVPEEVIYSWRDQIAYSGQRLKSVVPPRDRRVIVEFEKPSEWKDRFGDKIDAIRVITGNHTDQFELTGSEKNWEPPKWISFASPGRTCLDRVRIAIFGTRLYDEKTEEVTDGRVTLKRPFEYRSRLRFHLSAGPGVAYPRLGTSRAVPTLELNITAQYDLAGSLNVNFEANGQLTRKYYAGVELPMGVPGAYESIRFLRLDLRTGVEWWATRRYAAAILGGGGLGTPTDFRNGARIGSRRYTALLEAQPIIFTLRQHRFWLIWGVGMRLFEAKRDYMTDFLGDPTSTISRAPGWYMTLRFRMLLQ